MHREIRWCVLNIQEMIVNFSETINDNKPWHIQTNKTPNGFINVNPFQIWWMRIWCAHRVWVLNVELKMMFGCVKLCAMNKCVVYDSNAHSTSARLMLVKSAAFFFLHHQSPIIRNSQVSNVSFTNDTQQCNIASSRLVFVERIFMRYLAFVVVHIMETCVAVCTLIIQTLCKVLFCVFLFCIRKIFFISFIEF